jgi:Ni,Fe-hydrogenase III large subunit
MSIHRHLPALIAGRAIKRQSIPDLPLEEFQQAIVESVEEGWRVVSLFGSPDAGGTVHLYVVLADDHGSRLYVGSTTLSNREYPSLTSRCTQVHLFERELAEQCQVKVTGHPWLKPLRFQRPIFSASHVGAIAEDCVSPSPGVMDFYEVTGEEVHEVAVGPVHAGVIEPGHFRFQCHGERIFHLEISLGYQHRGVERALLAGPNNRSIHYAQTLCGDTTIGHTTAYCQVVEALAKCQKTARAQTIRAIALELERLANHVGDLGAMSGDVGFLPTASHCGRLRGEFLNMTAALCGSRFGRGLICPGGVRFDLDAAAVRGLLAKLELCGRQTRQAVELLWNASSVMARFEEIGVVSRDIATELGLVGPAARASGLARDARHDHPSGLFRFTHIPVSVWESGDVFARGYLRWLEIQRSLDFIGTQLKSLPAGAISSAVGNLSPDHLAVAMVEGWRGEVCHVALTNATGRFERYKVMDPSFHNWPGLAMAVRAGEISDFPLCNKSFSLSYCGHDL